MAEAMNRRINFYINGKEVTGSIRDITTEMNKLSRTVKDAEIGSEDYTKATQRIGELKGVMQQHAQHINAIAGAHTKLKADSSDMVGMAARIFTIDAIVRYGSAVFDAGKEMVALGAHIEASANKAAIVFGDTLGQVTAEAEANAAAMGLTTRQYVEQAAAIQDVLIPMGFQRQEAANISTQLTQLSGALSEWTGGQVSAQQVSDRLKSALTGERESLKELGIVISEEDIKNQLHAEGLDNLTGQYKKQAEAAATLKLILAGSTDAQTAYANNSDSLIRTSAELSAKFENVKEKLITALLPVMAKLVNLAGSIADGFTFIGDSLTEFINPALAATNAFNDQSNKVATLESQLPKLLSRYDELMGKTNRTSKEQAELATVIQKIGDVTPTAITQVDEYGKVLSINAGASREFLEAEKARLQFLNRDASKKLEEQIQQFKQEVALLQSKIALGGEQVTKGSTSGFGANSEFEKFSADQITQRRAQIAQLAQDIKGAQAELDRLTGKTLDDKLKKGDGTGDTNSGNGGADSAALEKSKQLLKQMTDTFNSILQKEADFEQSSSNNLLSTNDKAVEIIRQRYDKEIKIALEAQQKDKARFDEYTQIILNLERLRDQDIQTERDAQAKEQAKKDAQASKDKAQADLENYIESQEFLKEQKKQYDDTNSQIQEFILESKKDPLQEEIVQITQHYQELLELARQHGVDTVELEKAFADKIADVHKTAEEKEAKKLQQANEAVEAAYEVRNQAILSSVNEGVNAMMGFIDSSSEIYKALFVFSKALAIADVMIKLQQEMAANSSIAAELGMASGPAGPAVAAATAASLNVKSNIAAAIRVATIIGTTVAQLTKPKVKQRAEGGYHDVIGADDGNQYRAQYIGSRSTGLLPHGPSLVLANERGPEYFVANQDLRNPVVANAVRMIENVRLARVGQRAIGGFVDATAPIGTNAARDAGISAGLSAPVSPQDAALTDAINRLVNLLGSGVYAIVPDETIVGINNRFTRINKGSGNVLNQ